MAKRGNPNWVKGGPSPNPDGRPPSGQAFSDILRREAEALDSDSGLSGDEAVAKALLSLAKERNVAAIKEYIDRREGKPAQRFDEHIYQEDNPVLDALRDIIDAEPETEAVSEGE